MKVSERTHERLVKCAGAYGMTIGEVVDLLLEAVLEDVEEGRVQLQPARVIRESGEGVAA